MQILEQQSETLSAAVLYTLMCAVDIALTLKCPHSMRSFECAICVNPGRNYVGDYKTYKCSPKNNAFWNGTSDKSVVVLSPCPVPNDVDVLRSIVSRSKIPFQFTGKWAADGWELVKDDDNTLRWRRIVPVLGGISLAHFQHLPSHKGRGYEPSYMAIRPHKGFGGDYDPDDYELRQTERDGMDRYVEASSAESATESEELPQEGEELTLEHSDAFMDAHANSSPSLLRRGLPALLIPLPNKFCFMPKWKCQHGVTKARDGVAYACSLCSSTLVRHQSNWQDKLAIELAERSCGLCGMELEHWQRAYCFDCWQEVMWVQISDKSGSKAEYFTHGAAAKFQEVKVKEQQIKNLPTWEQAFAYLRKVVIEKWWKIPPDCDPGDLMTLPWLYTYFRDIPWVKTFVTRWWLVTHGCKVSEIEGYEGVQLKHYFEREGAKIRAALAPAQNPVTPLESAMSPYEPLVKGGIYEAAD